jgi:hypothetical protein
VRDTIPILITDTVKVREPSGDSVVVGWDVTLGRYNQCINQYNDHLDAFIGLNCATYSRLAQGEGAAWANDNYDSYIDSVRVLPDSTRDTVYFKIKRKGCALTSMAMVLQAAGISTDPGMLNSWMTTKGKFSSGAVDWKAVNQYNAIVEFDTSFGKGLSSGIAIQLSDLDRHLSACKPIIIQVRNPSTNRNHWVVVSGKTSSGDYAVVDPAGNGIRVLLSQLGGRAYKAVVYRRKS